ncbi:MAG: riboflavin biosynthesis protein RibF [Bradymonadia bacterium]
MKLRTFNGLTGIGPSSKEVTVDTYSSYQDSSPVVPRIVVIGNFDGLHRGHLALLDKANQLATSKSAALTVLTFSPHPVQVLAPHRAPRPLMSDLEKASAFKRLGVETVWFQTFTKEFAELSPQDFVKYVLQDGLGAVHVVVGYDFHFGRGRAGNVETLGRLLSQVQIGLSVIQPVEESEHKISSSAIRKALSEGELERAHHLLGWSYAITGQVLRGDARGRTISFPTLNIALSDQQYPLPGVYSGWVPIDGQYLPAVANLGPRPTVENSERLTLEVHVIGTALGEMYGQDVEFIFASKVREVIRFDGIDALKAQIKLDAAKALTHLEGRMPNRLRLA